MNKKDYALFIISSIFTLTDLLYYKTGLIVFGSTTILSAHIMTLSQYKAAQTLGSVKPNIHLRLWKAYFQNHLNPLQETLSRLKIMYIVSLLAFIGFSYFFISITLNMEM